MTRPSWNSLFMNIANNVAIRSTCFKLQTGAVLVSDNRIISIGYNGVCSGDEHCFDHWIQIWKKEKDKYKTIENFKKSDYFLREHHEWSKDKELHGETNCLMYAIKNGISTNNSILYTVYSPCINCAKMTYQAGIKKVYYQNKYKDLSGINFLQNHNIDVIQYN